jgi:probable HAF family extracellular repeat protein
MHDLGTLGGMHSEGRCINDNDQVVGFSKNSAGQNRAFLYDGSLHDLGTLGGSYSFAFGVNASGQVAGTSYMPDDLSAHVHAFFYDGTMHDLGSLGDYSTGNAINSTGEIVGVFGGDLYQHAFIYTASGGMTDLNSLIDPFSGWQLVEANGINDLGQITGRGYVNGNEDAFLLTPVPEPTSLALAAFGVISRENAKSIVRNLASNPD